MLLVVGDNLNNSGGAIAGVGALSANVGGDVLNTAGHIVANADLALLARGLDNSEQGEIQSAAGAVQLQVAQTLVNGTGSTIGAAGDLRVQAGTLANGGALRAGQDSVIGVIGVLANEGAITSARHTGVQAASLQSASAGVLGAGIQTDGGVGSEGDLTVTTTQALAAHGTQLAAGDIAFNGASIDLSRSQSSAANFSASASQGDITTRHASVVTPGTLSLRANTLASQTLINEGGQLNAGQFDLQVANIANTAGGEIVQTGTQATQIIVSGQVENSGGKILSNGDLALEAASIRNQGGTIQATGTSGLTIRTAGALDNSQGGAIGAGGDVQVSAGSLNNDAGSLTSAASFGIDSSGAVSNIAGTLAANQALTVSSASLDNTSGTVGAVEGDLRVDTQGAANNTSGKMLAGGALSLANAGLTNIDGQLSGQSLAIDTRGAALNNTRGTIGTAGSNAGALDIRSGALTNDAGLIQSAGAMRIDTQGQALSNRHAAGHATGQGGIASGAALALATGALDNSSGYLGAKRDIQASTGTLTNAAGGSIVGEAALQVNTNGAAYDNRGGQTLAIGAMDITAGQIDNSGALMRSNASIKLTAGQVLNRDTRGADQGIEARDIAIHADVLDNARGVVRADHDASVTSAGVVDNSAGLISARNALTIADAQPGNKALQVRNTGGTLVADQDVGIDAAQLTSDGTTTARRDLTIALTQDVVTNVDVSAGRNLSYTTSGAFTNNAKLKAGGTLTVAGANVDNNATGEMSGSDTVVRTAGTLNNRGLIDSAGHTQIDAGVLNNVGTGAIYGNRISISAQTLNNVAEPVNGVAKAGSIASREGDVDLGVQHLVNADDALIHSGRDLRIGGALDAARHATGRAQAVTNIAATIESTRHMALGAQQLDNLNRGFRTEEVTSNAARNDRFIASQPTSERFTGDELGQCHKCASDRVDGGYDWLARLEWVPPNPRYPYEQGFARKPYQLPDEGGVYASDNLVWTLFDVPPGDTAALTPKLQAYNADFMARAWRTYTEIDVTNTQTTETRVVDPGKAGRITSGGDMLLDIGAGNNTNSQVIAGGTLGGNADQLKNIEAIGRRTLVDSGSYRTVTIEYKPYRQNTLAGGAYEQVVEDKTIDLSTWLKVDKTAPGAVGSKPDAASLGQASASAGTTGAVNGGSRAGTVFEVASEVSGAGLASGAQGVDATGASANASKVTGADVPGGAPSVDGAPASGNVKTVVRTSTPDGRIPATSLFGTKAGASYLIETDPRFANYRNWLSSDYLLSNLGLDPATTQKRLGDGFYEQKLIREQVAQLTGYRYLGDYRSDDEQYTALMNNGAAFAQQYNLRPGVGLTAAQMAQLTSDIVWLVEQIVTLPDGSTQKVLVPQVYVRVKEGDIDGSGALLAGRNVDLTLSGDLTNQGGTIAGRNVVRIDADNIRNLSGGRITGQDVALSAKTDLNNIGATIDAGNSLSVNAGRDINIESTTLGASRQVGASSFSRTGLDQLAGLYVTGGTGTLVASAGRDVNLIGGVIANAGQGATVVSAGRDINLGTVPESRSDNFIGSDKNYARKSETQEVGSSIVGNGVSLNAGQDIHARQAQVDAGQGLLLVHAERNIDIEAGRKVTDADARTTTSSSSFLKKSTTTQTDTLHEDLSQGSSFKGGMVAITAGGNITGEGVRISGDQGVLVQAGGNLDLHEARDIRSESHSTEVKKSGLGSGSFMGAPLPTGATTRDSGTTWSNTSAVSSVQSTQGGVLLQGDGAVALQGVQLDAAKELTVRGASVAITGATDYQGSTTEHFAKGTNIGVSGWHDPGKGINAKNTDTHEETQSQLVRSTLSGANVTVQAKDAEGKLGDVLMAGTTVNTPGTLTLEGERVALAVQQSQTDVSDTSAGRDLAWQKNKGQGTSDQSTHYNQFNVGEVAFKTPTISADLSARDSVEQLAKQPGMGWIGQLSSDPNLAAKVDWNKVEEAHKNWQYDKQGLTPEGAAIVTLVVSYFTAGAAQGLGTSVSTAVGGTTGTIVGGAVTAGVTALASQAAVAVINNRGNLGHALDELGSSQNVKGLLSAIVTGGVLAGLNLNPTGLPTEGAGAQKFFEQLGQNLQAGVARSVINSAIYGGSLEDNLKNGLKTALLDTVAAQGAFAIGTNFEPGGAANLLAHALAGCAVGVVRTDSSGGCGAGAIGASIGELAGKLYDPNATNAQGDTVAFAAMISGIAAAIAGLDATEINLASQAGANAAANNWLATKQRAQMAKEMNAAKKPLDQLKVFGKWTVVSAKQDVLTASGVGKGLVESGINDVKGLAEFLSDPVAGLDGLWQVVARDDVRQQLGDSVFADLDAKFARMKTALQDGGDANAEQLGKDLGGLLWQVGSVVTGVGGAAKAGAALAGAGVKLTATGLDALVGSAKFDRLLANGGLFAADGKPLMDFKPLTNQQKSLVGELLGGDKIQQLVPGAQKIGRSPGIGETGIDDLFKVDKPGVDFAIVEYKFGQSKLGTTIDGPQMSDGWLTGAVTGDNRILKSVGDPKMATNIRDSLEAGRIERWLVHTDPFGNVTVGILDKNGKFSPDAQAASKLLGGGS